MPDAGTIEPAAQASLSLGEATAYGLIQGLTEFLPVSSSGHLAIAHQLHLGKLPPELELPFDVLLHAATLLAIGFAFRKEIGYAYHPRRWRLWPALAVAMLPAGLVGLTCKDWIDQAGDHFWIIGCCYLVTAFLLVSSERLAARRQAAAVPGIDRIEGIGLWPALKVGLVQVLGLFPGISRSGSTIAGGLYAGLAPSLAVSFSFLVGLPLIAGAAAKDALDGNFGRLVAAVGWAPLVAGSVAALVSGLAAVELLKLLVGQRRLSWFALYCAALAVLCFVLDAR